MKTMELIDLININAPKILKRQVLYCKVFLSEINITIDFKGNEDVYLSSNGFLTIGDVTFYNIGGIRDIIFY